MEELNLLLKKITAEMDLMRMQLDQVLPEELPNYFERAKRPDGRSKCTSSYMRPRFPLRINTRASTLCAGMENETTAERELLWTTASLTEREKQVVALLADGRSTKEVALDLSMSPKTVETHRKSLYDKLGFHSLSQLTKYAILKGLSSSEP